jgi:hypothetical protein
MKQSLFAPPRLNKRGSLQNLNCKVFDALLCWFSLLFVEEYEGGRKFLEMYQ